ncbi:Ctr copper transporter [Polychaeton citri CBS 116435]|uniref:Copper transport protein n=1 Tax=Polychaeton citri CBS 116435 TaxID=1314669 RepID=A0A9P4Q9T0_9PEZI|nr:Ctr copper transporter [Polychaeton citri CBS 116435]
MGGMDMGEHGGHTCKISMLWNWNTIDSCFIARSWHVQSTGAFAGTCIGMILLVMVMEALRRASKEYDAYIVLSRSRSVTGVRRKTSDDQAVLTNNAGIPKTATSSTNPLEVVSVPFRSQQAPPSFRPNVFQQSIRALLHMLQFAVAFFVMLMAMYYNGYVIICIFIGAFLGTFVFNWTSIATR